MVHDEYFLLFQDNFINNVVRRCPKISDEILSEGYNDSVE